MTVHLPAILKNFIRCVFFQFWIVSFSKLGCFLKWRIVVLEYYLSILNTQKIYHVTRIRLPSVWQTFQGEPSKPFFSFLIRQHSKHHSFALIRYCIIANWVLGYWLSLETGQICLALSINIKRTELLCLYTYILQLKASALYCRSILLSGRAI